MKRLIEAIKSAEPTEQEFKAAYLKKLKAISPGQPPKWYDFQADNNWKIHLKHKDKDEIDMYW